MDEAKCSTLFIWLVDLNRRYSGLKTIDVFGAWRDLEL